MPFYNLRLPSFPHTNSVFFAISTGDIAALTMLSFIRIIRTSAFLWKFFVHFFCLELFQAQAKFFFRLALSLASTFSSICYTSRSNSFFRLCFIRFRVHVKKEGRKKWKRIRMYHDKFKYALYFRLKESIGLIVSG